MWNHRAILKKPSYQAAVSEPPHPLEIPAIRRASQRALAARASLVADYPDWETWRRQARALKTQVIDHLDDYLDQLQSQVEAWGGQVLQAATGPAAHGSGPSMLHDRGMVTGDPLHARVPPGVRHWPQRWPWPVFVA